MEHPQMKPSLSWTGTFDSIIMCTSEIDPFFLIQSTYLYLLIGGFNLFTFNVIVDKE